MPHITNLHLFPIKSFDGIDVGEARLRANGSLHHDREFKFVDANGDTLDSLKKDPRLYQVRVQFDAECRFAEFSMPGIPAAPAPARFDLHSEPHAVSRWMSEALGYPVTLVRDDVHGFADDQEYAGPTVIGKETLARIAEISGHADVPRRLRANIVLGGMKPFEEDQLSHATAFAIGDAQFSAALPCVRCVVPARDPLSGTFDRGFSEKLVRERGRAQALNPAPEQQTQYIAAMNTKAKGDQSGRIKIGDALIVTERAAETKAR